MTLLSIDYGTAHVGLGIGDSVAKMAFPFRSLKNTSRRELLAQIETVIAEENVEALVVGEPLSAHTQNVNAETSRQGATAFAEQLKSATNLPVTLVDERFTTEQAKRLQQDHATADDHSLAAMLILQLYFDQQS